MDDRWKDKALSPEERTKILVDQMTVEEKVSQMTYFTSALPRFGIMEYNWWNECLHGVSRAGAATMFPQPIGMASSFDPEKLNEIAGVIADEARIKHNAAAEMGDNGIYKGLTMWTPNVNIFRDPRWGRGHETYGEDPELTSRMGVAFVKGLQGDDIDHLKCVATAKHFAVHSGPEAERHEFDVHPSKRDMTLTYLPAFKACVQEGHVQSVMGAYNRVNGKAACASDELLQKTLRDDWGFDGCVVSDCGAIEDIYEHHKLVDTPEEAAALSVNNGCDLCCGKSFQSLIGAVREGLIDEETITKSVYRLMLERMRLGLLDGDSPWNNLPYEMNDSEEHHQLSLEMARETLVMLKNDGILPLNPENINSIAIIGPNGDSRDALRGNYFGTPTVTWTVAEGIRQAVPQARLYIAEGCSLIGGSSEEAWGEGPDYRIAEALKAARMADVSVVVTGLNGDKEGEEGYGSGDRTTMLLPECQRDLLDALATTGKPMVLVNMTGSATIFPHKDKFGAIIQAWYPGQMGGIAIADVLFGKVSPSGKLPVTFYRDMDQVPDFHDYSMHERTYRYMTSEPEYPFGYGLSYTDFSYGNINAEKDSDGGIVLNVSVSNTGKVPGKETVQAYVTIIEPEYESPLRQLAAFSRVNLTPGESCNVSMKIAPDKLCVCDDDGNLIPHKGKARIYIGGNQPDKRSIELTGKAPAEIELDL